MFREPNCDVRSRIGDREKVVIAVHRFVADDALEILFLGDSENGRRIAGTLLPDTAKEGSLERNNGVEGPWLEADEESGVFCRFPLKEALFWATLFSTLLDLSVEQYEQVQVNIEEDNTLFPKPRKIKNGRSSGLEESSRRTLATQSARA
ncbi:hypothetical protein ONS96_005275 [Cadophora gregata f. sp. sojae]|nr:hypothetical protein ONS96_005275 [Cadophora gregata f. sp. sojae]